MSTIAETPIKKVGPQHTDGKRPEVDAAVDKLDTAIERFMSDPKAFRLYLKYKGAMHNYSPFNLMLIFVDAWEREQVERQQYDAWAVENPGASDNPYDPDKWATALVTKGYHGWKDLGRQVRKGAKAIALFKPIIITIPADKSESGRKETRCVGFEIIRKTFHIQDTDGPEYDTPTPKPMHDTDETREVSKRLCQYLCYTALNDLGVPKVMRDAKSDRLLGQANGCMIPKEQTITRNREKLVLEENTIIISSTLDYCHAAKTLAHEMAHVIAEHGKVTNYHSDNQARAACEAIAEGAAFVVMSHYGYDTADYTVPYIAQWTGDINTVKQVLKDIADVAKTIIDKTDARMHPAKES